MKHNLSYLESIYISICYMIQSVDMKPSLCFISETDSHSVAIKPTAEYYGRQLWIPKHCVFMNDGKLFERLRKAYSKQNLNELERLWKRARPAFINE